MSIETTRIHCTGCDYEYFVLYQPIELKCAFASGTVNYSRTRSWCHECDKIRDAELLPSLTRLKRELICLRGKGFRAWLRRLLPSRRAEIMDKQKMIQWRQVRTTPPRCLNCGSTSISNLKFRSVSESIMESRGFRHACGGRLIHDSNDKPGTRYNFRKMYIWLDPEGNRVKEKPT